MAATTRNGDKRKRNSNSNPKPDNKNLKLNAEQYWKLSALQSKWEVEAKNASLAAKDAEIMGLEMKVKSLEHKMKLQRVSALNANQLKLKKELDLYRIEVAQEIGVESLDPYIVDTDTFVLVHENEIEV